MADTYTHGYDDAVLANHRHRTAENSAAYLLPHLRNDDYVLDVGCGVGTITADLAARVARVTAIDNADVALDAARAEAAKRGRGNIDFSNRSVYSLGFADATFDVVHAHQVLQHLTNPLEALREMRRVCRPGGIVAVRDADYAAMVWSPEHPGLDRWRSLYRRLALENGAQPDAGRRLLGWALEVGFAPIEPSVDTWCFATPETRAWWGELWAERVASTAIARQALDRKHASQSDLDEMAEAWRWWAAQPDGWFTVVHGELICRV